MNEQQDPTASTGKWMVALAWICGFGLLVFIFSDLLEKQINDEYKNSLETLSKNQILKQIEKFKVEDEKRNFNALLSESKGTTKFHEETLPGGENYTELVFKIKDKER